MHKHDPTVAKQARLTSIENIATMIIGASETGAPPTGDDIKTGDRGP